MIIKKRGKNILIEVEYVKNARSLNADTLVDTIEFTLLSAV
jgi:hypothetical protein